MNKEDLIKLQKRFVAWEKVENEAAGATLKQYGRVTKMFVEWFPESQELEKEVMIDYKLYLIKRFNPSTVQNYITITNKFLKFCVNPERIDELKHKEGKYTVKNIKIQQRSSLDDVLEPVEYKRILRQAKKMGRIDMYLIMKVFAQTGIRVSELKVFTVENVEKSVLTVNNKGKIRNVPLRNDLRRELLKYCKENGIKSGIIFHGRDPSKILNEKTIWKNMRRIAGKSRGIRIEKVHAHSFRHLFAVEFMREYNDLAELADILGHTSIETTRIYARTTDKQKREKLERMKM